MPEITIDMIKVPKVEVKIWKDENDWPDFNPEYIWIIDKYGK